MKNKSLLLLSLFLMSSCSSSSPSTIPQYDGYELVYHDEFDQEELDSSSWNYMLGDGSTYGNPGWGNNEEEYYQEDNVYLASGNLVIKAKKESVGGKNYTSGRISSKGKVHVKYGKIEASIALPEVQGMWPAFWMLPETDLYGSWPYSGEIDIMEARGRVPSMTSSALHYGGPSDIYQSSSNVFRDGSTISEYHTYGVIWNERDISFYCDDNVYLEISLDSKNASKHWFSGENENELAPFDQDFYLLFNLAVGGNFDGNIVPEEDFNECEMKVDYIRIYQKI